MNDWQETKQRVFERDGNTCVRCGKPATDAHHRKLKGIGGSSDPERKLGMANLVSLCRICHGWCHANPAAAYRLGFLVHSWDDPEKVSVLLPGGVLWLKADGTKVRDEEWLF